MSIKISHPVDVKENAKKTYGCVATYAELIGLCEKELTDLYIELQSCHEEIDRVQRESMICLDSLKRTDYGSEDSQEVEQQRKRYLDKIEACRHNKRKLRSICERYDALKGEHIRLCQEAMALAESLKQPILAVSRLLEKYLSLL